MNEPMSDERLAEILRWGAITMGARKEGTREAGRMLVEAAREIDRLRAEVERLTAAFAELLECHAVPGYIQLDKDFHERMKRTLGPGANHD